MTACREYEFHGLSLVISNQCSAITLLPVSIRVSLISLIIVMSRQGSGIANNNCAITIIKITIGKHHRSKEDS